MHRAAHLIGVSPTDEKLFSGDGFACLDGSGHIPSTSVNDDFCDCSDGSDEPGTAACSGLERARLEPPGFYCANAMARPMYIYWSRVGDGICDCCDGSDEWQLGGCEDVCEKRNRARRQRMEQRQHEMKKGIQAREAKMRQVREQAAEAKRTLADLRAALPQLEGEVGAKRAALEEAQAAAGDDPEKKVSEYAKWMEAAGAGADSAGSAPGAPGGGRRKRRAARTGTATGFPAVEVEFVEVESIGVRSGGLVDFISFVYRNGDVLEVGGGEGTEQEPFRLEPGEGLAEIRGTQGGLLDSVQFKTTRGRESSVFGGTGGDAYSIKAELGKQIVGLERSKGTAGSITRYHECELQDLRSPEQRARDEAAAAHGAARRALEARQKEVQELEAKIATDFEDGRAAYDLFAERCGEGRFDKYKYKICVFGEATQGSTKLGSWSGWDGEHTHAAVYEGGSRCINGRTKRSIRVTFECGEALKVEAVKEPSQCYYEATMAHPAACDPKLFEFGGHGHAAAALRPHEAVHQEL